MKTNDLEAEKKEVEETVAEETVQEEFTDVPEEGTPVEDEPVEEEVVVEDNAPSLEELKKKLATTTAQKNHFREQAEKRKALETSTSASMSPADLVAVMQAGVHADDMERVERFALSEGVPIREAVNNPELQAMLDVRNEQRTTAVATNVENVRRGSSKVSAESLINRADKGDIPSSDDEIEALVSAKLNQRN